MRALGTPPAMANGPVPIYELEGFASSITQQPKLSRYIGFQTVESLL